MPLHHHTMLTQIMAQALNSYSLSSRLQGRENWNEEQQGQGSQDELDAFSSEELQRRPEVRIINTYAVVMAYSRIGLKGVGALSLLWATVVLLGGFVSDLRKIDFWYLTIIAFIQAAGLSDAMGNDGFAFFVEWIASLLKKSFHLGERAPLGDFQLHIRRLLQQRNTVKEIIAFIMVSIFAPAVYLAFAGPVICLVLSAIRLAKQDYVIDVGDPDKANLKPALDLLYCISLVHAAIYVLYIAIIEYTEETLVKIVSGHHGLSPELLEGYLHETKKMCANNPASTESWSLITYGAGLLDSQFPEDCASGGRVLTMVMDQNTSLQVRRLLMRSPRQRIQKLIRTLAWRSPAEREMRWLAARIVEHLAGHLNLAQFPGALECISSLLDTSCHSDGYHEALHLPFVIGRSKPRKRRSFLKAIFDIPEGGKGSVSTMVHIGLEWIYRKYCAPTNHGTVEQNNRQRENSKGIDEDLVLPGLRILENLAHDWHNCALIYNTNDLLSKIVAPVSSDKLVEDIRSSVAWTKVVDGSLKVVSRLMSSSRSSIGNDMRSLIADNSNAVTNLVAILDMDMTSNSGIIELKMRAIEILTQLALHHPTKTSPREFIKKALHIFIATDWLENYWTNETQNMKEEDKETASRLKEMAGEGLAMLSCDSKAINSFTECTDDHVHVLTELLDSNIKTIEYKINATDIVDIDINIGCRISAAVILKHLTNYNKETALEKVFAELLPVRQAEAISTPGCWDGFLSICCRNDIENPSNRGQDEPSASQSHHIQQCGERRLQAELISLVAVNLESNNFDFAAVLILPPRAPPVSLLEEFVVRLKKMVEDNMYATPACLAIQKLSCKMVTGLLQHDGNVELIDNKNIIGTLLKASKVMARFECSMIFSGVNRDCHGIALKPLSSVLAKQAEDLLKLKKRAQARALALTRAQVRRTNSGSAGACTVRLARRIHSASAGVSPT